MRIITLMETLPTLINFLQIAIMGILTVASPFIAKALYDLVKKNKDYIVAQIPPQVMETLLVYVREVVKAAEQAKIAELIDDKKQYAFSAIEAYLKTLGFDLDIDAIDALIEAAVFDEFNRDKQPATAVDQE